MNPDTLRMQPKAVEFVKTFFDAGKPVASLKTDVCNAVIEWVDEGVVVGCAFREAER